MEQTARCVVPLKLIFLQPLTVGQTTAASLPSLLQVPPVKVDKSKAAANKKEAAENLLAVLDNLLVFLKSHGALLNAVKPEMLLEFNDFER